MGLQNTQHLINSHCLTVICVKYDDNDIWKKLMYGLNDRYGFGYNYFWDEDTIDDLVKRLSLHKDCLQVVGINGVVYHTEFFMRDENGVVLKKNDFVKDACKINSLVEYAEQNNEHLIATVFLDKYSDWRHIYFKIAEKYKDKVCFVRFVTNEDHSDIRLQIESGENAWQYIPYRLDDGKLGEIE